MIRRMKLNKAPNVGKPKPDVFLNLPLMRGGVEIGGEYHPNLLLRNFWRLMTAILYNVDVGDIYNTGGAAYTARAHSGDYCSGGIQPLFGSGQAAPAWADWGYTTISGVDGSLGSVIKTTFADRIEISVPRTVAASGVKEVCLYHVVYNTANAGQGTLLGRVVPGTPPVLGQAVNYKIKIQSPWTNNFAQYLLGILSDTNQTAVNTSGATITMRTTSDFQYEALRLYLGTGLAAQSWNDYALTGPVRLSEARTWDQNANYQLLAISGLYRTPAAITVGEIGVVGPVYDSAAVQHEVLFARYVLPTPIAVPANELFTTMVQLYASA